MKPSIAHPGENARRNLDAVNASWSDDEILRTPSRWESSPEPVIWIELAVQAVHRDYLVCKFFDGAEAKGQNINVAKDPELRQSRYDGLTIDSLDYSYTGPQARTVTKNGTSESKDQIIIPKYHVPADGPTGFVGSIITAAPIATKVKNDAADADVHCQWREITNRAYANVEES